MPDQPQKPSVTIIVALIGAVAVVIGAIAPAYQSRLVIDNVVLLGSDPTFLGSAKYNLRSSHPEIEDYVPAGAGLAGQMTFQGPSVPTANSITAFELDANGPIWTFPRLPLLNGSTSK